jgi:anti-anti-sigma factor
MPSATLLLPEQPGPLLSAEPRPDTVVVGGARPALRSGARLRVFCRRRSDSVLFRVSGNLDIYTVPSFIRQIELLDSPAVPLLVDLADLRLLDSAGICALLSLRNRAHRAGRGLGLVGASPRVGRLLGYAGLGSAVTFGEDRTTVAAIV